MEQAQQGGFLGSSGVQAAMAMPSGSTGQMQSGTAQMQGGGSGSQTGMVRMGGYGTHHHVLYRMSRACPI